MCSPPVAPEENDSNNEEAEEIVEGWHTINMHLRHLRQRAARDGQIATRRWWHGLDFSVSPLEPLNNVRLGLNPLPIIMYIDSLPVPDFPNLEEMNFTLGTVNRGERTGAWQSLDDLSDLPDDLPDLVA